MPALRTTRELAALPTSKRRYGHDRRRRVPEHDNMLEGSALA
jgi:hypothetical protein